MIILYFLFVINQIRSDDCIISNITKITTKYLNNIKCIGEKNFRYVNFANFSNGDMIVETTALPDSPKRIFYGIKSDGRPFFDNQQYHATIIISGQTESNNARYEGEIFIISIDNNEYLFSIGKGDNKYAELYDLSNLKTKSQVKITTFLNGSKMINIRGSAINFKLDDINYVLFSFIDNSDSYYLFSLRLLSFNSNDIINNNPVKKSYSTESIGKSVSCFITSSNNIICMFLISRYSSLIKSNYYTAHIYIGVYNSDLNKILEEKTEYIMTDSSNEFNIFLKCIHLEREAGTFAFYNSNRDNVLDYYELNTYPTIIFKYYDSNSSINNYFNSNLVINLNKKEFNTYSLLNDLVKLSNSKLCYISTSTNKEELYIILLNIFNTNQIVIRYYTIAIFELYRFKFLLDMRAHLYNNYISFAFSFCRQNICNDKNDAHYPGFMIFSYVNGTNYKLNLTDYLFNNNEIRIKDLQIDLKENVRIDNNIFGLIYSGIEIQDIINCDNINLLSSLYENTSININYTLLENEKINITINSYIYFICLIKYIYIITEPNIEEYNEYVTIIDTDYGRDTADIFNNTKNKYKSRILGYYIILEKTLENECKDKNCRLCLEDNNNYCISCKYNYTINVNGNIKNKTCYPSLNLEIENESDIGQIIENTEIETNIIDKETSNNEDSNDCINVKIINNECEKTKINIDKIEEIFNIIKSNYKGENKIFKTENVIFQISTLEEQLKNNNISYIDLSECEKILKKNNNIPNENSLIIIKADIKDFNLSSTYVKYKIYNPINLESLNFDCCKYTKIYIPINIDDGIESLFDYK